MVVIPMAYSITTGIAAGFISYFICKAVTRKWNEISVPLAALTAVFVLYFCL